MAAIFIKLSEREISPNALAFHRFWISTIIFALWNQFNSLGQKKPDEQSQECESPTSYPLLLLFGVGVSTSISLYCWVWSLTWSGAANATLLRNFTPVFTILGGWLLFGRQFDRQFLMGSAIAIGGAIGIGLNDWQISVNTLQGDALALLCAVFYSGTLLIIEQLRNQFETTTIMLWRCAVATVLSLPIMLITAERIFPYSIVGWFAVVAFAIVCQVLGQGLLAYCLKQLSSGFIGITLLLEPLITAYFAWVIFAENLSIFNGVAFIIVLLGIYLAKSSSSIVKE
ncbi:MAG: DMT family transporter [Cyanobacteria bacterium P01_E01_bin.42]